MTLLTRLSLYFYTLRYLKPVQVWGRLVSRFRSPKPDLRPAPLRRSLVGRWCPPAPREQSQLAEGRFRFLNVEHEVTTSEDWNSQAVEKLWLYNLHYFDDLNARDSEARNSWHRALIQRWISENPPPHGNGWEPYPLSLRIVNWIKWALAGGNLSPLGVQSLAVQTRLLRRSLEFHLLGNHLFENGKALVFAGLFFEGDEAKEWFSVGTKLLERQIEEQVLADGGHFELSPMYHGLILEGLLDLINLYSAFQLEAPAAWRDIVKRMFDWLRVMCHPDGRIAFFNDAAFGVAPSLTELERYAADLGLATVSQSGGSRLLEASGYSRLELNGAVVIADVAAIGPDYLPGHAHADSLSFELTLHGQRVLVNSGTSLYGVGAERLRQRGTAAHNTLRLDGMNSSEVWSGFRVARRAYVRLERFDSHSVFLQAVHDGYTRLDGHPLHRRSWALREHGLEVLDVVEGAGSHLVEIFFHFHPGIHIDKVGPQLFSVTSSIGHVTLDLHVDKRMCWAVESGSWHPEFGVSEANVCLRGFCDGPLPVHFLTRLVWRA